MVKRHRQKKFRRTLGAGYYHPDAIQTRLAVAAARGNRKRMRVLKALLDEVYALPPKKKLTKSWRSIPYRTMRMMQMAEMRKTMTLQQIGDHFGLTRERVRQVLNSAKNGNGA